ncbi:MAG: transrane and repeat-containing protein, partial [Bacteroidetes bacterium]|nr:transrane and repeat-containing protein [Bacteroidota bacterium]
MNLSPKTQILLAAILMSAAQFVVYGPVLNNSFLKYDDDVYVYENKNIKTLNAETVAAMFARPYYRSYTPIAILSHAIDYSIWRDSSWGHHLTGLLLHSMNSVLVFLLSILILSIYRESRKEGRQIRSAGLLFRADSSIVTGAFLAAVFYSLHPVRAESVAWVSDRKDLLLALFLLPCIMAYIKYDGVRGTKRALPWFLVSLGFYVLAVLSKSIATIAPLLLISLDWCLLHRHEIRQKWGTLLLEKFPFFILSIGFGILAMVATKESQLSDVVMKMSSLQRALMPFYSVVFYPVKILAP